MTNFHINKIFFILLLFTSSIVAYAQDTTRLSLLFLGDIMQHGSSITAAYDPTLKKYNYDPCFQFIKPYIQSADLSIANLEVTLAGKPEHLLMKLIALMTIRCWLRRMVLKSLC
jgi:hypothetical protein